MVVKDVKPIWPLVYCKLLKQQIAGCCCLLTIKLYLVFSRSLCLSVAYQSASMDVTIQASSD